MSARSTRASSAVERLKLRSGAQGWSMLITGAGLFCLAEKPGAEPVCAPMELDDFVAFVNAISPGPPRRVSKLDVAFEKQLAKKPS